jgi:hypothetical protein
MPAGDMKRKYVHQGFGQTALEFRPLNHFYAQSKLLTTKLKGISYSLVVKDRKNCVKLKRLNISFFG